MYTLEIFQYHEHFHSKLHLIVSSEVRTLKRFYLLVIPQIFWDLPKIINPSDSTGYLAGIE
jgi:hypothetical protein